MKLLALVTTAFLFFGCIAGQSADYHGKKASEKTTLAQFSGGSGESTEDAVVIKGVSKQSEEVEAEYYYISQKNGLKNKDWNVASQTITDEKSKVFDVIEIVLASTSGHRIFYFDVSTFPWKKH